MSGPIINPNTFYWINVLGILQTTFAVTGILFTIAGFSLMAAYIYNIHEVKCGGHSDSYLKEYKERVVLFRKIMMPFIIIGPILIIISVFLPGRTTSIEMLVARTVTYENTEWTLDRLKEAVDYIVSAFK